MNAKNFAEWLKNMRTQVGLSQEALAERIDAQKAYISKLENATGDPSPTLETLDAIANALNVDLAVALHARGYDVLKKPFYPQLKQQEQLLLWMFNDLPEECQLDVMASVSGIHQRRSLSARIVERHEARATARADIESKVERTELPPLSRGMEVMAPVEIGGKPTPDDFHEIEDYQKETGKRHQSPKGSPRKNEQGPRKRKPKQAA